MWFLECFSPDNIYCLFATPFSRNKLSFSPPDRKSLAFDLVFFQSLRGKIIRFNWIPFFPTTLIRARLWALTKIPSDKHGYVKLAAYIGVWIEHL